MPARCIAASTSVRPNLIAKRRPASRIAASIWWLPESATARDGSPARPRVGLRKPEPRATSRSSWAGPGCTSAPLPRDSFVSRRSIRSGVTSSAAGPNRSRAPTWRGGRVGSIRCLSAAAGSVPHEVLHRRLAARVEQMLAAGLVAEVQRQLDAGVAPDAAGLDGIGYREVVAMVNGQLSETVLRDAMLVSTRRYAKRQDTWFRNQLRSQSSVVGHQVEPVWLLDATRSPEALASEILGRWKQMPDN